MDSEKESLSYVANVLNEHMKVETMHDFQLLESRQ